MRRLALAVVMLVALTTPTLAQDAVPAFSEGVAAYERGDYATTALRVYKVHAALGDAYAQNNLGLVYGNGDGVPADYAEAEKWTRLAAEQGLDIAQHNLGVLYSHGWGVPEDLPEAVKWIRLAAELGYAIAQHKLGIWYKFGMGMSPDVAEGLKWIRLAAEQGYAEAQSYLASNYIAGEVVLQDYAAQATCPGRWCFRAADHCRGIRARSTRRRSRASYCSSCCWRCGGWRGCAIGTGFSPARSCAAKAWRG